MWEEKQTCHADIITACMYIYKYLYYVYIYILYIIICRYFFVLLYLWKFKSNCVNTSFRSSAG